MRCRKSNFVKNIKRGSNKYNGKLPFKCFNCGEVGHFVSKCSFAKNRNSDEGGSRFKGYIKDKSVKRINFNKQNKNLYTNEDDNSSDGDGETKEILFMALEKETLVLEIKPQI